MENAEELVKAAEGGDLNKVIEYLNQGIDIETSIQYGQTALMKAAMNGHEEIVKLLVEKGADVNKFSQIQWNALCFAATRDHFRIVDFLIESGANVNAVCQDDCTILEWVIRQQDNRTNMVNRLLKQGSEIRPKTLKVAVNNHEDDIYEILRVHSAASTTTPETSTKNFNNKKKPWWKIR